MQNDLATHPIGDLVMVWAADERRIYNDPDYSAAVDALVGAHVPLGSRVDSRVVEDETGARALATTHLPTGRTVVAQLAEGVDLP